MPLYTNVYINDDGQPSAYGSFRTRPAAEHHAEKMERSLDADRDEAGGGVGIVMACQIQPLGNWESA